MNAYDLTRNGEELQSRRAKAPGTETDQIQEKANTKHQVPKATNARDMGI